MWIKEIQTRRNLGPQKVFVRVPQPGLLVTLSHQEEEKDLGTGGGLPERGDKGSRELESILICT